MKISADFFFLFFFCHSYITYQRTVCVFGIQVVNDIRARTTTYNIVHTLVCGVLPGVGIFCFSKLIPDLLVHQEVISREMGDYIFLGICACFFGVVALGIAIMGTMMAKKIIAGRRLLDNNVEFRVNGRQRGDEEAATSRTSRPRTRSPEVEWMSRNRHHLTHHFHRIPPSPPPPPPPPSSPSPLPPPPSPSPHPHQHRQDGDQNMVTVGEALGISGAGGQRRNGVHGQGNRARSFERDRRRSSSPPVRRQNHGSCPLSCFTTGRVEMWSVEAIDRVYFDGWDR